MRREERAVGCRHGARLGHVEWGLGWGRWAVYNTGDAFLREPRAASFGRTARGGFVLVERIFST